VILTDKAACRRAAIEAVKWLVKQQTPDGSMQPVGEGMAGFHKVPYAMALSGQGVRATKLCAWITANSVNEEGDLGAAFGRQGPLKHYYHYGNSWVIAGAQRLGQFGLSLPTWGFLASLQHPATGGFLTAGPEASLDDEQDMLSTAAAGLAALYMGQEDVAVAAGRFLVGLWDTQPASGARMYLAMRRGTEHVRVYEGVDEQYVLALGQPNQWYFVPGLAAGVLLRLWEVTGNDDFLRVAQDLVGFCEMGGADRYTLPQSGFFGWAAAMLFAATGNVNYQRIATAVLTAHIKRQSSDGSWVEPSLPSSLPSARLDATAEGLILTLEILDHLETAE